MLTPPIHLKRTIWQVALQSHTEVIDLCRLLFVIVVYLRPYSLSPTLYTTILLEVNHDQKKQS
jgi:hypothetical protein